MADALPLFEALARVDSDTAASTLCLPLSATLALHVKLTDSAG
jgi:hypothetical protein